jgi:hypothetical protein
VLRVRVGEGKEQDQRGRGTERVGWRRDGETWIKTKPLEREEEAETWFDFVCCQVSEIESRKRKVRGRTSTCFGGNHSRANNLSVYQAWLYRVA